MKLWQLLYLYPQIFYKIYIL